MTTNETVTEAQIEGLRREAAEAGDREQVRLCDRALVGMRANRAGTDDEIRAKAKCVRAIQSAEAMVVR